MLKGQIVKVDEQSGIAYVKTSIDVNKWIKQGITQCYVDWIDSRQLSDKQRRMCYALINAISEWSGSDAEDIKEAFKLEFWADKIETLADKVFSLADAPMSLVAAFQRFLVGFIIENDVPLKFSLLDYVDDTRDYVYKCLIHKKCCICGKRADLHHIDTIGMGVDRNETQHLGREVMSLCRVHHGEIHSQGKHEFFERYHLDGGIECDKTLMKIYGLRR